MRILFCIDHNEEVNVPDKTATRHQLCTLQRAWAKFIGWQEDPFDGAHFPLFNVCGHHKRRGTTLDANGVLRLGLRLPMLPPCPFSGAPRLKVVA